VNLIRREVLKIVTIETNTVAMKMIDTMTTTRIILKTAMQITKTKVENTIKNSVIKTATLINISMICNIMKNLITIRTLVITTAIMTMPIIMATIKTIKVV
jgi:hypothetical protein